MLAQEIAEQPWNPIGPASHSFVRQRMKFPLEGAAALESPREAPNRSTAALDAQREPRGRGADESRRQRGKMEAPRLGGHWLLPMMNLENQFGIRWACRRIQEKAGCSTQ